MAQERLDVLNRMNSLCASSPFGWTQAVSPFNFNEMPTGQIDQVFRIEVEHQQVIGGLAYSEEQTDTLVIWIARKHNADQQAMHRLLSSDVSTLRKAIVRDGSTGGGDFSVPDGGGVSFRIDGGQAYGLARMAIPVNYEVQL